MATAAQPAIHVASKQFFGTSVSLQLTRAIAILYAFFAGLRTVGDMDIGWQIATGRWIVEHRHIPSTDVLSYTAAGKPWIYPALSQVLEYLAYRVGGYALLSWIGAIACVATVILLLRAGGITTAALTAVAVPMIAARTVPRAEMFSQILFTLFVCVLWRYHKTGKAHLWLLPALMALWVNLHLGFVAGLGMCVAYVLLEAGTCLSLSTRSAACLRLRSASPWIAATFVATLVNPWGYRIYVGMFVLLPVQANRWIVELMPVRLTPDTASLALAWRDPRCAFYWFLGGAAVATVVALVRRLYAPALILGSSIYCSLHAARFAGLFAVIVVVIAGAVLADGVKAVNRDAHHTRISALVLFLCILVLCLIRAGDLLSDRYYINTPEQFSTFGAGESDWYPTAAANFVLQQRLPGNIFNDYNSGGFLAGQLSPTYPVYIDGRGAPYGVAQFLHAQDLLRTPLDSPEWQSEASVRNIQTVILSLDHEVGSGLVALAGACTSATWRPIFFDTRAAIFVRSTPETAAQLKSIAIDCATVHFDRRPVKKAQRFNYFLNAGTILIALHREREAQAALDAAQEVSDRNPFLHYARGILLQQLNRDDQAEAELKRSVAMGSLDAASALARLYDDQARYADEAQILQIAVGRARQPYEFYVRLAFAQLSLHDPTAALGSLDAAERENPFTGDAYPFGQQDRQAIAQARAEALAQLGSVRR